jgi:hypothetical protein
MKYLKYILALAALAFANLTTSAYAQTVTTYTEAATGSTKQGTGVSIISSGTIAAVSQVAADNQTAPVALNVYSGGRVFNGTNWDRQRGDANGTVTLPGLSASFWRYTPPTGGLLNTTVGQTVTAAAGAGVRNYIWSGECWSEALGTATEIELRDGAAGTAMWRSKISTGGLTGGFTLNFNPPLKSTANTLVEFAAVTASVTGAIYCSFQGTTGS